MKDAVLTAKEYENVAAEGKNRDDTVRLNDLNEEAFEDIILRPVHIDHTAKQGRVVFSLVNNCKMAKYPEGDCKLAWDRLFQNIHQKQPLWC